MKIRQTTICLILIVISGSGSAQFLSYLNATKRDALYTTYAAPMARSHYKTDQGYQFQWFDDESGVEFVSTDGPNLGMAFTCEKRFIFKLRELYREPVITTSYSDLVRYFYYPVKDIRVEVLFVVYSSETAIVEYRLMNEGQFPAMITIHPYVYLPAADSLNTMNHSTNPDEFSFPVFRKRDGWMVEHEIPVVESLTGSWTLTGCRTLTGWSFIGTPSRDKTVNAQKPYGELIRSMLTRNQGSPYVKGIIRSRNYTLEPGDAASFRVTMHVKEKIPGKRENVPDIPGDLDLLKLVKEDEQAYSQIPKLNFTDKDKEMLYWSCFSLMRQCMMPPEGECRQNYYVFSREPRWGWGYGGQVFHESLAMMAYAYMDPEGAMNSQRVYMERQRQDGYINYRTGPYLNETIETKGKSTSSAPWFNFENLEIFKITGDRKFLKEAYVSGKKFYQYYVNNRDSNNNGLCEWGAHAELESVRDARVAVWENVGWASNFEGPDVNSMLVMEAKSLAEMAKALGLLEDSKQWHKDAVRRTMLINETMWDPESRFYYNVNKKDQSFTFASPNDLKIKEIIGFLPLWAGVADVARAKALVEKMQDTTEFWRPFGVPSLAASEPPGGLPGSSAACRYNPIGYWNGPVWVQWEYLLYRGLRDNGHEEVANQLASRVLDNMIYHLKNDHLFWEFYSADDRQAGWNKTYIWAGIAARLMLDQ